MTTTTTTFQPRRTAWWKFSAFLVLFLQSHPATGFQIVHATKPTFAATASACLPKPLVAPLLQASANDDNEDSVVSAELLPQDDTEEQTKVDWNVVGRQFGLFKEMAVPYYKESIPGRWLLAGLLALTLLNSGVSVAFSYLGKDFWNALSAKDSAEFYFVLQKYLAALIVGAPVVTMYRYQRQQLAIHWREWMTARTFELYTSNRVYYNVDPNTIDNPDQRMAEDVQSFTGYSLKLIITIITSLIDLVSFSLILWSIYPQLFAAIIVYAAAGTIITALLGKPLVHLNIQQLQREADMRYSLVRLRDNAESIAFYAGEDLEGQAVEKRLQKVTENRREINAAQRNLEFFTTSYRYLVQIVPVAVVAPKFFAGDIALGVISQSVGAFNHILSDLSIIVNQFEQLSGFSAGIERLAAFYENMRLVDPERLADDSLLNLANRTVMEEVSSQSEVLTTAADPSTPLELGNIALQTWSDPAYEIMSIQNLDLCTPDRKRLLIRNLSFSLKQGENLLIVGDSGAGKSSLLRAIAGLWTAGNGAIQRPLDEYVYFLPQRPYCALGSLKDQLLYPSLEYSMENNSTDSNKIVPRSHLLKSSLKDEDLLEILERVMLLDAAKEAGDGDPVKGLYSVLDWSNRLSLGEQQRLAFGRLLVNRQTKLVILDESTSALDIAGEAKMYSILKDLSQRDFTGKNGLSEPGLTFVSVGHRPSLVAFHDKRLRIGANQHEFSNIPKSSLEIPSIEKF